MRFNAFMHLRQVRFVGPVGVGKSSAIRAVSDVVRHQTGAVAVVGGVPREVTEVGEWEAPGGAVISVVAASEREVPSTARQGALPRASSTVPWLYGDSRSGFTEAKRWLDQLAGQPSTGRLTVAVTRMGPLHHPGYGAAGSKLSLEDVEALVWCYDRNVPVLQADPRERADVVRVLAAAMRGSIGLAETA